MALFPLTYYITHSSPDYRQPIEPLIVVLAVVGVLGPQSKDEYSMEFDEPVEDEVEEREIALAM